jgi:hypothetical protein
MVWIISGLNDCKHAYSRTSNPFNPDGICPLPAEAGLDVKYSEYCMILCSDTSEKEQLVIGRAFFHTTSALSFVKGFPADPNREIHERVILITE